MWDRIRLTFDQIIGVGALSREHEEFLSQLSEIEKRQLELDTLVAELEARVAVLEEEHAHDALA